MDPEKGANTRQCSYVCLGLFVQVLCLVVFVGGALWGTAAVLELTQILGVDSLPGGVVHVRVG